MPVVPAAELGLLSAGCSKIICQRETPLPYTASFALEAVHFVAGHAVRLVGVPTTCVGCPDSELPADRVAEVEALSHVANRVDSVTPYGQIHTYPEYVTSAVHLSTGWL